MYASALRLIGGVSVKETPTHIIVNGIPGIQFTKDIYNFWSTSRISTYMFSSTTRSQIKFPRFFAVDVLFMLEKMIAGKRTFTAKRTLIKVHSELMQNTWLKDVEEAVETRRLDYGRLDALHKTLLPHQREFLENYEKVVPAYHLNGMMLAAAPGAGKTLTAIALGLALRAGTNIFVVPKNSINRVWETTMNEEFKVRPDYWTSSSETPPVIGKPYYIVHYEYLGKFLEFVKANPKAFGKVFINLDESHNFNEMTSQRTQLFIQLCQVTRCNDVIWSSGTPLKSVGYEAIPFLKTIDPFFDDDAELRFRKIFGKDAKRANEILCNRIGLVSFKVLKEQIATPGYKTHELKVKIPDGERYTLANIRKQMTEFIEKRLTYYNDNMAEFTRLYEQCMSIHAGTRRNDTERKDFQRYQDYVKVIRRGYDPVTMKDMVMYCNSYELRTIVPSLPQELRKPFLNVRAVIKYVELKVLGEALSRVLGQQRIQCHVDMLPYVPLQTLIDGAMKKTLIFTSYVEVIKELGAILPEQGYKTQLVYGETSKDLASIVKQFHEDEDLNPLCATFKSLSTAVPITVANTVLFLNAPFRDYERNQAISRADRIGQDTEVHVYDVYLDTGAEPNISTRSKDILQWSAEQVASILGIKTPTDLTTTLESLMEQQLVDDDGQSFINACKEQCPLPQGAVNVKYE